jgi:AAA domain
MGNFPQGDSAIYFDYKELLKKTKSGDTEHGIIGSLLETSSYDTKGLWTRDDEGGNDGHDEIDIEDTESNINHQTISAENLNLAVESDPSQDEIVVASQDTKCLVVRGPPGTGKSQVIVNLISDALAKHKSILLVCQKRAALDVVHQRLHKVGLAKYAALLHDPSKDRKKIYYQMEQLLKSKTGNDDLDKINSRFKYCSQRIDDLKILLDSIAAALWKPYFGGISAHQLYLLSDPNYRSKLDLSDIAPRIKYYHLDEILQTMKNLAPGCRKFDMLDNYPWIARADFSKLYSSNKNNLVRIIDEITDLLHERNTAILTYNKEDQQTLFESLNELLDILGRFYALVNGYRKYDNIHYVWSNRNDFSSLTYEDKKKIESTIDKISNLLQDTGSINLVRKAEDQVDLCFSLDRLIQETGVFRRLNPKWIQAQHDVRRLLGQKDVPNDITYLHELKNQAIRGLTLWRGIDELSGFLNLKGTAQMREYISSRELEAIPPILHSMKGSLKEFDELVLYDKKKRELLSEEAQLRDRWNNAHSTSTKVLNQSNAQAFPYGT